MTSYRAKCRTFVMAFKNMNSKAAKEAAADDGKGDYGSRLDSCCCIVACLIVYNFYNFLDLLVCLWRSLDNFGHLLEVYAQV
jgi:hypothetical protein